MCKVLASDFGASSYISWLRAALFLDHVRQQHVGVLKTPIGVEALQCVTTKLLTLATSGVRSLQEDALDLLEIGRLLPAEELASGGELASTVDYSSASGLLAISLLLRDVDLMSAVVRTACDALGRFQHDGKKQSLFEFSKSVQAMSLLQTNNATLMLPSLRDDAFSEALEAAASAAGHWAVQSLLQARPKVQASTLNRCLVLAASVQRHELHKPALAVVRSLLGARADLFVSKDEQNVLLNAVQAENFELVSFVADELDRALARSSSATSPRREPSPSRVVPSATIFDVLGSDSPPSSPKHGEHAADPGEQTDIKSQAADIESYCGNAMIEACTIGNLPIVERLARTARRYVILPCSFNCLRAVCVGPFATLSRTRR